MTSLRKRFDVQLMREARRLARAPVEEFIASLDRLMLPAELILPAANRIGPAKARRKRQRTAPMSADVESDPDVVRGPLRLVRSDRRLLLNRSKLNVNRVLARYEDFLAQGDGSHFSTRALRIKATLCERLGHEVFQTWFENVEFEDFAHGIVYASVSTRFVNRWISARYYEALLYCCQTEFPGARRVEIAVRPHASFDVRFDQKDELPQGLVCERESRRAWSRGFVEGSPLDPQRTLETFVVAPGNRSAHAAAMGIVEGTATQTIEREPVYFHGAAGVGKTHLLHAMAWEMQRRNPEARILYLSAERFRAMFVASVRRDEPLDFIRRVCAAETFMIDGLDLLYGEQSIEALDHIVEMLVSSGHQLVAASRSSLADIKRFGESLRRGLSRGRVAAVDAVGYAHRYRSFKHSFDNEKYIEREPVESIEAPRIVDLNSIFNINRNGGVQGILVVQWVGNNIVDLIDRTIIILLSNHSRVPAIAPPVKRQQLAHAYSYSNIGDAELTRHDEVSISQTNACIPNVGIPVVNRVSEPAADRLSQLFASNARVEVVRLEDLRTIAGVVVDTLTPWKKQRDEAKKAQVGSVADEVAGVGTPARRGSVRLGLVSRIDEGLELELFELGGKIKFFDHTKGYGFITPDEGLPDVLLHVSCLRAGGYQTAPLGARVRCQVLKRPRGLQAFRILDMDADSPSVAASVPVRSFYVAPEPQSEWERAVVEWFDRERGYGFLKSMSDGCAIFVHGGVLLQSGFATLRPRERLEVRWGSSAKGRVAVDLRPAGAWDEDEPRNAGDGC